MRPSERGAALLTVLLLVAVMAVLAGSALERLRLATRLAGNAAAIDQARAYAFAAEAIAAARISQLVDAGAGRTTLAGGWQGQPTVLPLPGGRVTATVRDGGNCFNLNSVVSGEIGNPDVRLVARPAGIIQFVGLMRAIGIDEGVARPIGDALADFIDSDQVPLPQGAEDEAYAGRPVPHRTAGGPLADASELRAIAGMTPELYQQLRPWVCALPATDLSPINVNTLTPEQAPLLAMLSIDQPDPARAQAVLARRPAAGWEGTAAFWNDASRAGLESSGEAKTQVRVGSQWFALELAVGIGDVELNERALIDARLLPARLVRRSWGEGV